MDTDTILLNGIEMPIYSLNTVVVGTGAAGFNAADSLYNMGNKDIAIITEGINMGTSRNTGSDKQTYYKLTLAGEGQDSVSDMAKTLHEGGSMHGDIAMIEAALSARSFFKLVNIGVPFPHNRLGEYIGYKTDHDPRQRATSAGPLTSRFMTEKLEEQVKQKNIKIFDGFLVVGILTNENIDGSSSAVGVLALDKNSVSKPSMGFTLFNCTNVVYATGGPAGIYFTSVYPTCHTGSSGVAFEAGAAGVNLTESQYGIASTKFRWNLSGTYQQVLPRYISTDNEGNNEREFLTEYFSTPGMMLDAIFLKGYQWPFDPRKINNSGSSLIDILVYNETQVKGRRVFLDFMHNTNWGTKNGELDFSILGKETYTYLENSGALSGTPYQRLEHMNKPAVDLYRNNGINLANEYLEIAVCAQHNNGGLSCGIWWESNIKHLFPVGEVCGTFGVYRPGGSALNSTQTGSLRAAQYICSNYSNPPLSKEVFTACAADQVLEKLQIARDLLIASSANKKSNILDLREKAQRRMTAYGAHIRSLDGCNKAISEVENDLKTFNSKTTISDCTGLLDAFKNRDILITQLVYLTAIKEYILCGGKSRGSYLIADENGILPEETLSEFFRFSLETGDMKEKVLSIRIIKKHNKPGSGASFECSTEWEQVRPVPAGDYWFENVWNDYLKGRIIK